MEQQSKQNGTRWMITINNYSNEECKFIMELNKDDYKTICFYYEVGELCNTPHLQGYIVFKKNHRFNAVKKIFTRANIQYAKGNHEQCLKYCRKGEKPLIDYDINTIVGKRNEFNDFIIDCKSNQFTKNELIEKYSNIYIRYNKAFYNCFNQYHKTDYTFINKFVYYFYGATGTGKTRTAVNECQKNNYNFVIIDNFKWIGDCINDDTEAVILDDFRGCDLQFSHLLRLLDGYTYKVECKGGFKEFKPLHIYITSSTPPNLLYSDKVNDKNDNINQLLRRITEIREFKNDNEETNELLDINNLTLDD